MKWEERLLQNVEKTSDKYIDIKNLEIGKVISMDPLQIINGELPLLAENLYINPDLLEHIKEFTTLTGTIGDSATTITNGSIYFKSSLEINDLVMLKKMNKTTYAVMFKVMKGV